MVKHKSQKNIAHVVSLIRSYLRIQDVILLLIIGTIGVFFFFYFYRKAEFIEVRVKVTDQDVLYASNLPKAWYANRFEKGDVELDAVGKKITEIVGVESHPVSPAENTVYLDLLVKAVYNSRTGGYSVKGRDLAFGAPVRFNLAKVTFDGFIVDFPGSNENQKSSYEYRTVTLLGRNVEEFIATSVKVGDTVVNSNGDVLVRIEEITSKPAAMVVTTSSGDVFVRTNPIFKDLFMKAKVRVKKVNDRTYLFEDLPFGVDQNLPINLPAISLFPAITSISEAE